MTDVTDATFNTAVVERSSTVPVVVDLWAPWCGPCRTLGPIIEQVIADTDGKVELAKVNVDENPAIAQAFQAQSIPAVYAMKDGQIVDGFIGAYPEPVVREFVGKLIPSAEDDQFEALVAAGDETSLRAALELRPDDATAIGALAELLVGSARSEEALELLAKIPETAETRRIAALARTGAGGTGRVDAIEAELAQLIDKVKDDSDARQKFVDLLEVMGPEHPNTASWRRKLTSQLF